MVNSAEIFNFALTSFFFKAKNDGEAGS